MAANLEDKDDFERMYGILFKLYTELEKAYKQCILKRQVTECCIRQCRKLLSPWSTGSGDGTSTSKQGMTTDNELVPAVPVSPEQEKQQAPNPDIQALDEILAKAQQAREIQKKIEERSAENPKDRKRLTADPTKSEKELRFKGTRKPIATRPSTSGLQSCVQPVAMAAKLSSTGRPSSAKHVAKATKSSITGHPSSVKPVAMATKPSTTGSPGSVKPVVKPVVKQPVLMKKDRTKQTPMRTTYGASYGKKVNSKGNAESGSGQCSARDYLNTVIDRGGGKAAPVQQKETRKLLVPKQIPVVQGLPKDVSPASICDQSSMAQSYRDNSGSDPCMMNTRPLDDHGTGEMSPRQERRYVCQEISDSAKTRQSYSREEQQNVESERTNKIKNDSSEITDKLKYGFNSMIEKNQETSIAAKGEKHFSLLEDGHSLTIPKKYRKLKTTNIKLCERAEQMILESYDSLENTSETFTCKLEKTFAERSPYATEKDRVSHMDLMRGSSKLLKEHELLCSVLESLIHQSESISEDCNSWETVYKCYSKWQHMLRRFREMQKEAQQLLAEEEFVQRSCPCGTCAEFTLTSPRKPTSAEAKYAERGGVRCVLLHRWLPTEMLSRNHVNTTCSRRREVTYSNHKELRSLNQLLHDAQLLSLEVHIQEHAGKALISLLRNLDTTLPLYVPLYRLFYGLLCHQSKGFPSMVLDISGE